MYQRIAFTTLPRELRERVYRYIALGHTTRRVGKAYRESVSTSENKITTSAITATCHLIHNEYEDVARKTITTVEFTAIDMDFTHIIDYFHRQVNTEYLAILQANKATIRVNMVLRRKRYCRFDMAKFYTWALFLIRVKLEVAYRSDSATWMAIHHATDRQLVEDCVIQENSTQLVRDNIDEIRKIAGAFDEARWCAYPNFSAALQAIRHREVELRISSEE